jgi:multidrug resistance efflux pump
VKVVQRIPVRIDFTNLAKEDGDYVLRPGLSVTPEVEVKTSDVPSSCPAPARNATASPGPPAAVPAAPSAQ